LISDLKENPIQKKIAFLLFFMLGISAIAQHKISIDASLLPQEKSIAITQDIVYMNTSDQSLQEIYLNDWANSFSTKTSPLAKRFAEDYKSSFHFEKEEDRGRTTIYTITDASGNSFEWDRPENVDVIRLKLNNILLPGKSITIKTSYKVKLPDDKFTRYGVNKNGDYRLKYWFLSPAVFNGSWQNYSNKNTDDLFLTPSDFDVTFNLPKDYTLTSDFDLVSEKISEANKTVILYGEKRMQAILYLEKKPNYETIVTDRFEVVTNLEDKKVTPPIKALLIDRIAHYLNENVGEYPFKKMVVSETDYKMSPVYGLNQLPNFISPFPDGFEYDMEQLKTMTHNFLENTLSLDPRTDYWLYGALQINLMMDYVDTYYPKMKIIGNLSNFWIIRWAHVADLEFNDQYPLLYLNMARNNLHQPLSTSKDSLVKFNKNIANDYYGGNGLQYLSDYLGNGTLKKSVKQFYSEKKLKPTSSAEFQQTLSEITDLPVNWFFDNYVDSRNTIDFKIKKVKRKGDSLIVTIQNKKSEAMPVSLYGIDKDSVIVKKWLLPIDSVATTTIPSKGVRKLVLNYESLIPEYNRRNNYKSVRGILNRPLQFRLFQDVEDPDYNQLFVIPIFEYNLYDGISVGAKLYNKTVLPKSVYYKLEPQYGFTSKTLIGSASISLTQNYDTKSLYAMRYGISGNYYSYDQDLFYKRFSEYITFAFRNPDLRDNEKQYINLRNITVSRDENPNDPDQEPNYNVFNFQYVYSNPNLINYYRGSLDYELSQKFSKITAEFEYRKLFLNNRQLDIRAFAGVFVFNDTREDEDFFSFALDRPTDYLFNYNYYGRSEDTGLFSQQLIVAEGGFKSQLEPAFANSWITTVNASTSIWKWIYAYADAGLVHNSHTGTNAVYDTGIRLNLVADYFELYFPMYSSNGFEPGQENYDQKIRFIVTLSPKTLLSLFTRRWY